MCQWIRLTMECLSSLSKCSSSRAKPSNSGWNVNRLAGRGASGSSSQRSLAEPVYWCCIVNRLATLTNVVSCHIHWKLCRAPGWCRLGPWSLKSFFRHTDQCPLPRCVVPHSLEVMSCPRLTPAWPLEFEILFSPHWPMSLTSLFHATFTGSYVVPPADAGLALAVWSLLAVDV